MPRELLSARALESALRAAVAQADAKNTRVKIPDGDNLMLIVRPGGGASWVLQYRWRGQRKPLTLGPWPDLTLRARNRSTRGPTPRSTGPSPAAVVVIVTPCGLRPG
jgi:hypothetical protein